MRNEVIATLLVVAIIAGAGVGYYVGSANQSNLGLCSPWGSLTGAVPAGVNVTVSYQGNWRLSIVEFRSNQTRASALDSVCYYEGNGRISFYVSIANYQGWNTVVASAHSFGAGTLTVTVMVAASSKTNSTTTAYGDATTSFSFFE
jgi:hypothetical protein